MSHIRDLLSKSPVISFEFFPPRTKPAEEVLANTFEQINLAEGAPDFVSVTYGAMGSTRDTTIEIVKKLCRTNPFPAMAHLTCVGHNRAEIKQLLNEYASGGVDNLLALSGDPIDDFEGKGEFEYALELVELIMDYPYDFTIGVAAHPEIHPRSKDKKSDRKYLAEKLKLVDFAITQFFFYPKYYFELVEELAELGNTKPIIPGVIPVTNTQSVRRFSKINEVAVDEDLMEKLDATHNPEKKLRLAIEAAQNLSQELLEGGAPGIHIYTLNQSQAPLALLQNLRG